MRRHPTSPPCDSFAVEARADRAHERGAILLISLLLLLAVSLVVLAASVSTLVDTQVSGTNLASSQAFFAAEAAVTHALHWTTEDPTFLANLQAATDSSLGCLRQSTGSAIRVNQSNITSPCGDDPTDACVSDPNDAGYNLNQNYWNLKNWGQDQGDDDLIEEAAEELPLDDPDGTVGTTQYWYRVRYLASEQASGCGIGEDPCAGVVGGSCRFTTQLLQIDAIGRSQNGLTRRLRVVMEALS